MATFTDYFKEASKDKVDIKSQVKLNGQPLKTFKAFAEQFELNEMVEIYTRELTGDVFIWNNPTYGYWNQKNWSEESDITSFTISRVIPPNGIFTEQFVSSYFIDGTSGVTFTGGNAVFT